ncbi:MAG: Nif3-like dinuclear metal center hexameric protein [Acidobacteriota bacterium]
MSHDFVDRDRLVAHLDDLLASDQKDYCPNGLQVEGRREIRRLVTAVSSCEKLFEEAAALEADAVMVHHGLFWQGMSPNLVGVQYRRVKALIEGGMSLIAYHLPLDRHGEIGNNALAAREGFRLARIEPFAINQGQPIGFKGIFPEPISASELVRRCESFYEQAPLTFLEGPDSVRTLGIVSGGAQRDFYQAVEEGLDAFITGEVSEWVMNIARETGTHYLAAGHYATERCGIRRLGEHVGERFGVDVRFVDIPNPV